jgi:hypothetical protein
MTSFKEIQLDQNFRNKVHNLNNLKVTIGSPWGHL